MSSAPERIESPPSTATFSAETSSATMAATVVADRCHPAVDMTLVGKRIRRLHDQVCGHGRRVEITRAGCDDVCVMISKRELDALETAVALHAATPAYAELCQALSKLLGDAGLVHAPRAYGEADVVRTFADDCAGGYH